MNELGVTRVSLFNWRKAGMPYVPLGTRAVRYDLYAVLEWLEGRKAASMAFEAVRKIKEESE